MGTRGSFPGGKVTMG